MASDSLAVPGGAPPPSSGPPSQRNSVLLSVDRVNNAAADSTPRLSIRSGQPGLQPVSEGEAANPRKSRRSIKPHEKPRLSSSFSPGQHGQVMSSRSTDSKGPNKVGPEMSKEKPPRKISCCERIRIKSRQLCDSWRFCVLTTALTFYALFGDDFRLAATHKRTDVLFNVLTIFCILVFCIEVVAASLGKEEYFLGFFFMLDTTSTVTLLMDLTWIGNALFCSTVDDSSTLRTTRAGRAGARAGRTVRIIRLIRLVKLYKTYKMSMEQKEQKGRRRASTEVRGSVGTPGVEDQDDDNWQEDEHDLSSDQGGRSRKAQDEEDDGKRNKGEAKSQQETRVGKKLSDMTTRRVIILVLVMLFGMPQFLTSSHGHEDFRSSAYMGMEMVYERWRSWCPVDESKPDELPWCLQGETQATNSTLLDKFAEERWWFEYYLLTYLYSHHDGNFAWQLHWLGVNSTSLVDFMEEKTGLPREQAISQAGKYLGELARLAQPRWLTTNWALPMETWDGKFTSDDWQIPRKRIPESMKSDLVQPWIQKCISHFYGVAVMASVDGKDPSVCSIEEDLRCSEVEYYMPITLTESEEQHVQLLFAFDSRGTTQLEAGLSMLQTIFICFAVGIGAMTFSNDANQLLLNPIERMIAKMETIKDNPLEAMKLGDFEYRREEIENAKRKEQLAKRGRCWKFWYRAHQMKEVKRPMETVILEKTIIKLGGLLALGFGEAGAEIIGQNMQGGHSAGVNAMVPGQKVDAIIGFCNIRSFTDATEVLKEKVMLFVNQVGEIVHGCVDDYHGAPNKNIGDAFLLVWRLSGVSMDRQTKLADMAIMSFVRIIAAINKSPVLAEYRGHPGMLQRVANYRVQMGFGLHCGWAIEGAIGSEFKIDASYLSPNVNVASRLEAATVQFGVWILISHFMINLCSQDVGVLCRLIDHVTVKGSKQPIRLYTLDLDYFQLEVTHKSMDKVIKNRFKVRQVREVRKNEKWNEDYNVSDAFDVDEDLIVMRSTFSQEFFQRFTMAYRNYEAGEWMVARDMFYPCHFAPKTCVGAGLSSQVTEDDWPADGPTITLLSFMKQGQYIAPCDWPGHRVLTEK
mmetsp:Transcript_82466/g.143112  ORF Transcript_82466/g.143112 Transcript_82466/m.143112 type:complete len:1083 (+) Transcript_82466:127-3375(+)